MPIVYQELRRLAARQLRREQPGHTFRPTDLVSEAYLRLAGDSLEVKDRVHFFAVAARLMRQILVDHARRRRARKRGAGQRPTPFDERTISGDRPAELIELDEALEALSGFDERKARAVELHYFVGLTHDQSAQVLGVHPKTVARDLRLAEAWIHSYLTRP
jgi:RNA polymerase sigma factor (TIGR02999 family)